MKRHEDNGAIFRSGTQTLNSSLDYARDNKSLICVSMIFAGQQKDTFMLVKKHPFTCCPAAKHENAENLALQTYEKNQWTFYITARALTLAPAIILLTQVPLQKCPFL